MKKILLTTVAFAAFTSSASALEAGKMYMKADLGSNLSKIKFGEKFANGKDDDGAVVKNTKQSNVLKGSAGDIGFGYALSDSLRTDITFNMQQGETKFKDVELNDDVGNVKGKVSYKPSIGDIVTNEVQQSQIILREKKLGLIANVYYDFNNSSDFTPYAMAGVGIQASSLEAKLYGFTEGEGENADKTTSFQPVKSKSLISLGYQVGLGVDYEMSKDIFLDVGYKVSGSTGKYSFETRDGEIHPEIISIDPDNDKFASPKLQHTMNAGVRFAF
jgi:opacity protein-like surface antigen